MVTQNIKETQLILVNTKNTGLLSKVDDNNKKNKFGLNPLFTILNTDFSPEFKKDYERQRTKQAEIINREYVESKQKDIIRLFKEVYPEDFEEKLTYCLNKNNKFNRVSFQTGLDTVTRSLPISLTDIEAYTKRGGYVSYVFSHEARPEIIVFDFDNFITPEEVETIKKTFRKYLYLMEYKEHSGHLHIYLNSTIEDEITYTNQTKETLFKDEENNRINIDVFKASKRVTGCSTPYNEYTIIYDEKPPKTIELRKAINLLGKCLGINVNNQFLETILNPEKAEVPQVENSKENEDNNSTNYNSNNYFNDITPPKETPQENKRKIIQEATPLFNFMDKSHNRETLYRSLTGALIKHGYTEKTIEEIVISIQKNTPDRENRISSVRSCFKGQRKGDHLYRFSNFEGLIKGATEDPEILTHLKELKKTINEHDKKEKAENKYYTENRITHREANLMKGYIKTINNTLTQLQELHPHFTEYFTKNLTHILRHCNLNNETITHILDPNKYEYNLYETLNKKVNDKTQLKSLIGMYKHSLIGLIATTGKDKKQEQKLKENLILLKNNEKELYDIINYNTTDIEEVISLTYEEDPDNIQNNINKILRLKGIIDIRLKTILKNKCTNKIQANTIVELSKLINMKYELFIVDTLKNNGTYQSTYYNTPLVYDEEDHLIRKPYITVNRTWLLNEFTELINTIPNYTPEDITLNLSICGNILNNINNAKTFNNNIIELENVYIEKNSMNIINKAETQETILTNDRLGLTRVVNTHEEIKLFTYDSNITVEDLTPENTTDTVRIVKEILIPRQDQNKKEKFLYFIQLLGLMVHGNNDIKILPVFYRENGDNGKGVLSKIIKKLFGKGGANDIKANRISDDFINEVIKRTKHALINDELKENTIKDNLAEYKQLTGASGLGGRAILSPEVDLLEEIPPLFLASNPVPNIPVTEDFKAIIKRLNLIKMPNVFKNNNANPNLNEYNIVSGIDTIINTDYEGLSQLLSLAINEFRKLDYTGNVRDQLALTPTIEETMSIISSSNPLINFISLYTKKMDLNITKDEWITTKDIRNSFTEWYKLDNKGIEPPETLFGRNNQNVGYALQDVYGKEELEKRKQKPINSSSNIYCFRLLNEEDVEIKRKQLIEIHNYDPVNKWHKNLNENTLAVFNIIKNSKLNNEKDIINRLITEGYTEEDIINYLKVLDNVDLIEYKEQSTL